MWHISCATSILSIIMEIFNSIKEYFIRVGIDPMKSTQKHPFNVRNLIASFLLSCCIASIALHIIYVDNSFKEYTNALNIIVTILFVAACFAIYVLKMETAFDIINTMEYIINKSEWTSNMLCKSPQTKSIM